MFENLTGSSAQMEQYRMAMRIVNTWDAWRMWVIWAGVICLLLAIILFVSKKRGRIFFLILAILLGLGTFGMDKFKTYVAERKKEAVKEAVQSIPTKIIDMPEKAMHTITQPLRWLFPSGDK